MNYLTLAIAVSWAVAATIISAVLYWLTRDLRERLEETAAFSEAQRLLIELLLDEEDDFTVVQVAMEQPQRLQRDLLIPVERSGLEIAYWRN